MIIVDPAKIAQLRLVVDEEVVRIGMSADEDGFPLVQGRSATYAHILRAEFDTQFQCEIDWTGWSSSLVLEGSASYAFHDPVYRVATNYMTSSQAARWILSETIVARDPELLAIAAVLRILDHEADIGMDVPTLLAYYGPSVFLEIADCVSSHWHVDCDPRNLADPDQLLLWPEPLDVMLRRASIGVSRHVKRQALAWARYEAPIYSIACSCKKTAAVRQSAKKLKF